MIAQPRLYVALIPPAVDVGSKIVCPAQRISRCDVGRRGRWADAEDGVGDGCIPGCVKIGRIIEERDGNIIGTGAECFSVEGLSDIAEELKNQPTANDCLSIESTGLTCTRNLSACCLSGSASLFAFRRSVCSPNQCMFHKSWIPGLTYIISNRGNNASFFRAILGKRDVATLWRGCIKSVHEMQGCRKPSTRLRAVRVGPGRNVSHVGCGFIPQDLLHLLNGFRGKILLRNQGHSFMAQSSPGIDRNGLKSQSENGRKLHSRSVRVTRQKVEVGFRSRCWQPK